jgi:hypothetical protein
MNRIRLVAFSLAAAASLAGCISVFTTTSGAATIEDAQAEELYKAVYAGQMANVRAQMVLFAPAGTNPGVCNVGGSKQACYDADAAAIQAMQQLISALEVSPVPPRYVEGDRLLREAIGENIRGLALRNQAIANNDNAAFAEHKVVLDAAVAALVRAYEAFPADNRPQPPP